MFYQHYSTYIDTQVSVLRHVRRGFVGDVSVPELVGEPQLQARVQRHTMEQRIEHSPYVQILDAPVPQVADYVLDVFRALDSSIAEQVIEVPKLSYSSCRSHSPCLEPQMAEQLVEVPRVLPYALLQQRNVEQIVGIPVPHRGGSRSLQGSRHASSPGWSTGSLPSSALPETEGPVAATPQANRQPCGRSESAASRHAWSPGLSAVSICGTGTSTICSTFRSAQNWARARHTCRRSTESSWRNTQPGLQHCAPKRQCGGLHNTAA